MKAELRAQKTRVQVLTDYWYKQLGMNRLGFHVSHVFVESFAEAHHSIVAETEYNWEYRDGVIRWYLARIASLTEDELSEAVVHEFVHVILASMESCVKEKHSKLCEFAVESMTQAILAATT